MDFAAARWLNEPMVFDITDRLVTITTQPNTDFWQRSYYGFRKGNAPALLVESDDNFTFTVKASFRYRRRYDQCGVILYVDAENWFKASVEFETDSFSRLGSVVTNRGYSDWATTDIPTPLAMWYRLSRRGPDFLVESSPDGTAFKQMRIFHLRGLGETTREMTRLDPPPPPEGPVRFGLYACSPMESSFEATFERFRLDGCSWRAHAAA